MSTEREFEINIFEILWAFWKRIWCIALAAIICGVAGYAYTKTTSVPTYKAGAMIIINNKPEDRTYLTSDLINTSKELANTYTIIIKSHTVLDEVIKDLNLDISYETLCNMVSVSTVEETPVLKINVSHTNRAVAVAIVEKILAFSPELIVETMNVGSVNVIERPAADIAPTLPSATKSAIIWAFVGAIIVCGIIVVILLSDNTYSSERDVANDLDYPVLGVITSLESSKSTNEKKSNSYSVRGNI